jgi:ParB family chromosome partitioning protein
MKLLGLQEKDVQTAEVRQIPIDLIVLNPYQPRKQFYEESLQELADSIRNFGVIQPILVRRKDDQYELIAGERRLRASKLAGLALVPAIVTDYSNQEMAEVALVENLQREDLGFMDEAEGYRLLIDEFGITQEELAVVSEKVSPR